MGAWVQWSSPLLAGAIGALLAAGSPAEAQRQPAAEAPLQLERDAQAAVEQGTDSALRARWAHRLEGNANDRAARYGLAVADELTYRYDGATAAYRALSGARPADRYAAHARVAWARMDELRGRMGDAMDGYAAARVLAQQAGDAEAEGLALLSMSYLRANAVGIEAGTATLDSAERVLPEDPAVKADVARRRATLLAVQLDPRAAAIARAGIAHARRAGDRRMEANAVRALALDFKMRGVMDSSRLALEETARLQRAARDRRALSETLIRIADLQITDRRLGEARVLLLEAEREALASRNDYALASASTGLGSVALRVRDLPAASRYLAKAAALNVASNDSGSLVVVQGLQSTAALEAGLLDTAWVLRQGVLAKYERSNEVPDAIASHQALATIALERGDARTASRELDLAEGLVRRHKVPGLAPSLWYARARVHLRERRDADAARLLTRYLGTLRPDELVARWDTEVQLAGIRARAGDARRAAADLARATDALDRWRAQQGDSVLRLLAFQVAAHEGGASSGAFAAAIAALVAGGESRAAFALAERQRARTLAERLVEARTLQAVAPAQRTPDPGGAGLAATTVPALQVALPADDLAIVQYVTGRNGAPTTAFLLTRRAFRTVRLASADSIAPRVRRLLALLERGDDARAVARGLGEALLQPLVDAAPPGLRALVVVPDGALHRIPFDALRLRDGRAVIERFEVSVAPSAAVAAALWHAPARQGPVRVLAVGDPERSPSDGLPPLPYARREARLAARFGADSRALTGRDATVRALQSAALDSFRVLHFAAHAVVDERTLAGAAIMLAPDSAGPAALTPGMLSSLPLGADLVVLSACRSAGGVVVDGEGVQGLTTPLLAAGARAIVATGWAVDDRAAAAMVEDLYRGLSEGKTVGGALRSAKLAAMERGMPAREWAAFTVIGDGGVRVPLAPPSPIHGPALAGAAAVTAAGAAILVIRRRRRASPRH